LSALNSARKSAVQVESGVPLFDTSRQIARLLPELRAAMDRVIGSQPFVLGDEVQAFEREIAAYLGVKHAIGVSSGTDALTVALLALGIGPGDEVITTPFTFFATTGAILRVGATPVFADIDPATYNLDPRRVAAALSPRTRAILPVHLFGLAADMSALSALAREHDLFLIEDAAQAIGAEALGQRVGSLGTFGCFSFFPTKNLGAFGDAGLVCTNDARLAEVARGLRGHGFSPKHFSRQLGGNFRLDALQAAVLRVKLPHLDDWNRARRSNAALYREALPAHSRLSLPQEHGAAHVYHQFVVATADRARLEQHLMARGIASERYYPHPIHLQETCRHLGYGVGDFPVTEAAAEQALALPVFPDLEPWMLDRVAQAIREF